MPMDVTSPCVARTSNSVLRRRSIARTVHSQKNATAPPQSSDVERGKYLVDEVAMRRSGMPHAAGCRRQSRLFARDLQGALVWIVPVHADTKWSNRAPAIAGLPGLSDAQAQTILEKESAPRSRDSAAHAHLPHESRGRHRDHRLSALHVQRVPAPVITQSQVTSHS